jgi:hypothetical protein
LEGESRIKEKMKKYANKTKQFLIKHKKKILVGVSAVSAVIGTLAYFSQEKDDSSIYKKYTNNFFKNASDDELALEREKVRLEYANAGLNNISDEKFNDLFCLLNKFDNVIGERAWNGEEPRGPVHSENGWYLSDDG